MVATQNPRQEELPVVRGGGAEDPLSRTLRTTVLSVLDDRRRTDGIFTPIPVSAFTNFEFLLPRFIIPASARPLPMAEKEEESTTPDTLNSTRQALTSLPMTPPRSSSVR